MSSSDDLAAVRRLLEERRDRTRARIDALARTPELGAAQGFGKRIGDGTTEAVERLNRTAAAQSISTSLEEVERALAKLDEGTYGVCDDCGEPIAPERLEAIPWTALCVRDASKRSAARA